MTGQGLRVTDLFVKISGARIIEGLSLTVSPGQIVGLAGRNGAGKTTTLRAISGMLNRTGGTVELDGRKLSARPEAVARAGVSHVPEGRGIFPDLTVDQNIRLGLVRRSGDLKALRDLLDQAFPVVPRLREQRAGRLSGGEQQMVVLYRGLVSQPRILLVDEMSLGLSPQALNTAIDTLARVGREQGTGILVVDQNSRMLFDHCDVVYVLRDGQAQPWNDPGDLASAYFN
jgi:branched-chain amino acid transport system ATP-binding protein